VHYCENPERLVNRMNSDQVRNRRKVDFLIAGTQKGGTSALDAYLREHPAICMANRKEVHFFDNERIFSQQEIDYAVYHALFSPRPLQKLLGEATPIYMYWYDAPRRIWQYNSAMKLIIVLRNPIERAFSQWNMERNKNADSLLFYEALQCESERRREALPYQHRVFSYIDRGFYVEQLRRLWTYFPKNQTLILRHEEFRAEPDETLDEICRFLGVESMEPVRKVNVHSRPYRSTMSRREWDYLKNIFEYEIRALERLLGWDCSRWLYEPEAGMK
jgi:hypothetical protein